MGSGLRAAFFCDLTLGPIARSTPACAISPAAQESVL